MRLNADFSRRVAVHAAALEWQTSPVAGVERRMLDRIGAEVARATSIVRYAPGSAFSAHVHGGGEEFLVLSGVFQDEYGDYPAGSYVRNPPQSRHTPGSAEGCEIFVKLWQFDPRDRAQVTLRSGDLAAAPDPDRPGVTVAPLYRDAHEDVRLETWPAGATFTLDADGGAELFVVDGGFTENGESFRRHSWLRSPNGSAPALTTGPDGARVWIKSGHLRRPPTPPAG